MRSAAAGPAALVGGSRQMIDKPHVDWFAISPSLSLLVAAALLLMVAVFVPAGPRRTVAAFIGLAGFVTAFVLAVARRRQEPRSDDDHPRLALSRPLGGARPGPDRRLRRRRRADRLPRADARRAHRGVLRAADGRRGRDGVLRAGGEPAHALPRPRVVLDRALRADGDRHRSDRVARSGAQVPGRRRGRLGNAALRLGARLRPDRAALIRRDRSLRARRRARCSSSASR